MLFQVTFLLVLLLQTLNFDRFRRNRNQFGFLSWTVIFSYGSRGASWPWAALLCPDTEPFKGLSGFCRHFRPIVTFSDLVNKQLCASCLTNSLSPLNHRRRNGKKKKNHDSKGNRCVVSILSILSHGCEEASLALQAAVLPHVLIFISLHKWVAVTTQLWRPLVWIEKPHWCV